VKKIKTKLLLGCFPLAVIPLVFIILLSLLLGGNASFNASSNAPAGVPDGTLATARAIVSRIKQEVPQATNNGLAAFLGCWQAESDDNPKRAEGDTLPYPVGSGGKPDSLTYDNAAWSSLGGAAIYGSNSPYAPNIQERGLGLGQYTNGRNLALQAYAKKVGRSWWELNTQLDYIMKADSGSSTLKHIVIEQGDVATLTAEVFKDYEGGGASGLSERVAFAQAWANWLNNPNTQGSGTVKGNLARVNALVGTQVGDGQCYALASWLVSQVSGFKLQGLAASAIGSDNRAALTRAGWKVISNPQASDLKSGAIVCWQTGAVSSSPYGHTGVINSVSGNSFTTYEQNANGNQTVQLYQRTWESSLTFVLVPPQK
jgi:hypothetical protein